MVAPLGRLPDADDSIDVDGHRAEAMEVGERRRRTLRLTPHDDG